MASKGSLRVARGKSSRLNWNRNRERFSNPAFLILRMSMAPAGEGGQEKLTIL